MKLLQLLLCFTIYSTSLSIQAAVALGQIEKRSTRDFSYRASQFRPGPQVAVFSFQQQYKAPLKEDTDEKSPWVFSVIPTLGYNSNPAEEHDRNGAAAAELKAGVKYSKKYDPGLKIELAYEFDGIVFDGASADNDEIDNTMAASFAHDLPAQFQAKLDVSDLHVIVNERALLNSLTFSPALLYVVETHGLSFGPSYEFSIDQYLQPPASDVRDPDAQVHAVGAGAFFSAPETGNWKSFPVKEVSVIFNHGWNNAHGDDYDYERNKFKIAAASIDTGITNLIAQLAYSFEHRNYANPNSLGAGARRRTDVHIAAAALDYLIWQRERKDNPDRFDGSVFLEYEFKNQPSNIQVFDFERHKVMAGLKLKF
jgi:hypothetical protein